MATVTYNADAADLAIWFTTPQDYSAAHDEDVREYVLKECQRFTAWGKTRSVRGGFPTLILKTPGGRCLVETERVRGVKVVTFDYIGNPGSYAGSNRRRRFWMNASSIGFLGDRIRKAPHLRREFEALFLNAR